MTDERRRFFRINDTVTVAYRLLTEEELQSQSECGARPVDVFSLISNYETKIEKDLSALRVKEPLVADVLDNINLKLNCIINQMEMDSRLVQRLAHKVKEVNISACGMGFWIDETVEPGKVMSLDLILRPSNLHIFSYGSVVSCEKVSDDKVSGTISVEQGGEQEDDDFYVRVDFQGMEQADQEVLIQHIVKRQGKLIRASRELEEQGRNAELQRELHQGKRSR